MLESETKVAPKRYYAFQGLGKPLSLNSIGFHKVLQIGKGF